MRSKQASCAVIIVTHNSQKHLHKAMECLRNQTKPAEKIVIVDSGSTYLDYLEAYRKDPIVDLSFAKGDIGFCKGNNIGWSKVCQDSDYIFLLNPDAFITPSYIERAVSFMEHADNQHCAALTGTTLRYDIEADRVVENYDTTGIFPRWYGGWYERGQGEAYRPDLYQTIEEIPAICGALFFCRKKALESVLIRGHEILDNNFYMYKEDIDLSLRLRKKGWVLKFVPELMAYHCRGWSPQRSQMPRNLRLYSAKNEWRINARKLSPVGIIYSGLKYAAVKIFNI